MSLSCALWVHANFEHPCCLWAGVHSPRDTLRVEQPPVLSTEPTTYYLHLTVPHSSIRSVLLIPSFNALYDFINFCEAPPPPFSCLFFRLFHSLSHCSSYRSSSILLIILFALFWNFFSLSTPFWERKTRTVCSMEEMSKSWTYIVAWWWRPVFSLFLPWQLLALALPLRLHTDSKHE